MLADLSTLKEGQVVRIISVPNQRLQEMGVREGIKVEIFRAGNPLILKINSMKIVVGRSNILGEVIND